jgi:hypothetical protein
MRVGGLEVAETAEGESDYCCRRCRCRDLSQTGRDVSLR